MSGVLVFASQKAGQFSRVIFEMLGLGQRLAQHLGEELQAVIIGQNLAGAALPLGEAGAQKVYLVEDQLLANYTSDGFSKVLVDLIKQEQPSVVLLPHNAEGKDLAPALAQKLGTGQVSDVIEVDFADQLLFKRPIYAGKALAHVAFVSSAAPMIVTIRPKAFAVVENKTGQAAQVINFQANLAAADIKKLVKDIVRKASTRVQLSEADIVVSGGRGMKSGESFKLLEELADVLGAAVGGSRAAVDEGWIEAQYQVGQTGKVVAPTLYIACGISGAIQHLAGMSSSKVIVAINKDPEAEIFKVADYGILGDALKILPLLIEEFRKALAAEQSIA